MSQLFRTPRLPDRPVKLVLLSGEYPVLAHRLREWGIEVLETYPDPRLPKPVAYHPDMQACLMSGGLLVTLRDGPLEQQLRKRGIPVQTTENFPGNCYPADALCNAFVLGEYWIGNPCSIDPVLQKAGELHAKKLLSVRQGYASCSVAIVNECSVITADTGIASAMRAKGFQVLRITPGAIRLPGYDTGFLGGCCGLLAPGLMAFSGKLDRHPDGTAIRNFLRERRIAVLELTDEKLLDIGGIIPLG